MIRMHWTGVDDDIVEKEVPASWLTSTLGCALAPPPLEEYRVILSPEIRATLCAHEDPTRVALLAPRWSPQQDEVPPYWGYLGVEHIPKIALQMDGGTSNMTLLVPRYEGASWLGPLLIDCFEYEHLPPPQAYAHLGGTTVARDAPRWDVVLFRLATLHFRY